VANRRKHGMKPKSRHLSDDMRAEHAFDYSKGVRGKYHRQLPWEGSNVVVLLVRRP
jgi:hypothetical protein